MLATGILSIKFLYVCVHMRGENQALHLLNYMLLIYWHHYKYAITRMSTMTCL